MRADGYEKMSMLDAMLMATAWPAAQKPLSWLYGSTTATQFLKTVNSRLLAKLVLLLSVLK